MAERASPSVEILRSRLPGNRVIPDPVERRRLLKLGAEMEHAVEHTLELVSIKRESYRAVTSMSDRSVTFFSKAPTLTTYRSQTVFSLPFTLY